MSNQAPHFFARYTKSLAQSLLGVGCITATLAMAGATSADEPSARVACMSEARLTFKSEVRECRTLSANDARSNCLRQAHRTARDDRSECRTMSGNGGYNATASAGAKIYASIH